MISYRYICTFEVVIRVLQNKILNIKEHYTLWHNVTELIYLPPLCFPSTEIKALTMMKTSMKKATQLNYKHQRTCMYILHCVRWTWPTHTQCSQYPAGCVESSWCVSHPDPCHCLQTNSPFSTCGGPTGRWLRVFQAVPATRRLLPGLAPGRCPVFSYRGQVFQHFVGMSTKVFESFFVWPRLLQPLCFHPW